MGLCVAKRAKMSPQERKRGSDFRKAAKHGNVVAANNKQDCNGCRKIIYSQSPKVTSVLNDCRKIIHSQSPKVTSVLYGLVFSKTAHALIHVSGNPKDLVKAMLAEGINVNIESGGALVTCHACYVSHLFV